MNLFSLTAKAHYLMRICLLSRSLNFTLVFYGADCTYALCLPCSCERVRVRVTAMMLVVYVCVCVCVCVCGCCVGLWSSHP